MLEGLRGVEGGDSVLPFVSQFYSSASTYLWDDESGATHEIVEGEGGEQGDPLMPSLFAVGQHRALIGLRERQLPDEHLMAFLDDIYIVCRPERVVQVHYLLRSQLWHHGSTSTKAKPKYGTGVTRSHETSKFCSWQHVPRTLMQWFGKPP